MSNCSFQAKNRHLHAHKQDLSFLRNYSSHFVVKQIMKARYPLTSLLLLLILSTTISGCITEPDPVDDICGCTDNSAQNFSIDANCDDGSCVFLDEDVKTLNTLFTSTGCGGCGVWGVDCHTKYAHEMLDKAIPFELHFKYGDPMINATSDSFVAIARPRYSPFFAVGLIESMDLAAENRPMICEKSEEKAEGFISTFKEEARNSKIGISHTIKNGKINVHYAYELADFEGLQCALYILENNIVATQNAGWKNDVEGWQHQNVVREAITPVLGHKIKESKKVGSITFPINENWNQDELYAAMVIWEPNTPYLPKVVNAEDSME